MSTRPQLVAVATQEPEVKPPEGERLHRLCDLPKIVPLSDGFWRSELRAGRLACYRAGRAILVADADLRRWLAARRVEPQR